MRRALIPIALLLALGAGAAGAQAFASCRDGTDDDADGLIDYPADPGCASFGDDTEDTPVCTGDCICAANPDTSGGDTGGTDPDPSNPTFRDCDTLGAQRVCPLERQQCTTRTYTVVDPATGTPTTATGYECPSAPGSPCGLDPADGQRYCSPHACVSKSSAPDETFDTGQSFPADDGPRDATGHCLGQLALFGGAAKRCRRSGTQTAFQDCCHNDNPALQDTVGAQGEPDQVSYRKEHASFEFYANQCDQQDQETALLADSEYCVYLGTYCAEKWPLVGCVQRNQSYCCFNSKLAKMIQEQGRAQIPSMGGFGSARSPSCRGFTMEEFQALDFTRIDLSDYYADLRTKGQALIQGEAQDAARRRLGP